LAYLINNDPPFRGCFIKLLNPGKRFRESFWKATAATQVPFPRGRVDLVLNASNGRKILVEVKISSGETMTRYSGDDWKPQIKKYLGYHEGDVAYLTMRSTPSPDGIGHCGNFLGQSYFEDLYTLLSRLKKPSIICQLFKEFMEEQRMTPPKPLTRKEIHGASGAFEFAKKCEDILNEIREHIVPEFGGLFKSRTRFTSGHFSPEYEGAYFYTKSFHRGAVKRIYIFMEPAPKGLLYGISAHVYKNPSADALRKRLGWDIDGRTLYKGFYMKGGNADRKRMIAFAIKALRELKRKI